MVLDGPPVWLAFWLVLDGFGHILAGQDEGPATPAKDRQIILLWFK